MTVSRSLSNCGSKIEQIKEGIYRLDGTPSDCVLHAIGYHEIDFVPDLVISGINNGFNLSLDVVFSGTCAAAAEAVSWGYKAIAVSCEENSEVSLKTAEAFVITNIEHFMNVSVPDAFLSINIPSSNVVGVKLAKPSMRRHRGPVDFSDKALLLDADYDSDIYWINKDYITVSSIYAYPMECVQGRVSVENYIRRIINESEA